MLIITSCSDDSLRIKKVIVKDNSARLIDSPKTKSPITFVPIGTELDVIKIKDVKKGLFNTKEIEEGYYDRGDFTDWVKSDLGIKNLKSVSEILKNL